MNTSDEKIQALLEKGTGISDEEGLLSLSDDFKAYELVFKALKEEDPGPIPFNFASSVAREIRRQKSARADRLLYIAAICLVIFGMASAYLTVLAMDKEFTRLLVQTFYEVKWIVLSIPLFALFIHFFDRLVTRAGNQSMRLAG